MACLGTGNHLRSQMRLVRDADEQRLPLVRQVHELDPEACRRQAARFDMAAMCSGYERVYRSLALEPARATTKAV